MPGSISIEKGGRNAAFFFFFLVVAACGVGGSLQVPLTVLRFGACLAASTYVWSRRREGPGVSRYALLTGGFVFLALGHSFSSVYFWVAFQHALNLLVAAVFLSWAFLLFREEAEAAWRTGFRLVLAIGGGEVSFSLYQKYFAGDPRPSGTFGNPNFLAEFLSVAALFALGRLLYRRDRRTVRIALAGACAIFLFSALTVTGSRGVLLSAVPAAGLLLMGRYGRKKGAAVLAACGLPVLVLLGYGSISRFFFSDIYNYSRLIIWKSALRTFVEHPAGVGLGGFKYYWYATQEPVAAAFGKYAKFAATAHSEYLEVLTGLGAVGLILFLLVLLVPLALAWKARREIPVEKREMAATAVAGLLLSGTHAVFDFNFHEYGIVLVDAMLLGALLSCLPDGSTGPRWRVPSWGIWAGLLLFAVVLIVSACTFLGAVAHDRGEEALRHSDEHGAERLFRIAATVDPLRAPYADSLSAIAFRRYGRAMRGPNGGSVGAVDALDDSIRWEARASSLNPRETKYLLRLSSLFAVRSSVTSNVRDLDAALRLASESLRINPFSVKALWYRSGLLASAGRMGEAVTDLERSVVIEPNFCRGYGKLSEMSTATGPGKAAKWKEEAESCRRRAVGLSLEDYEKSLVEDSEKK
jgi:O-antigen ligase